MDVETSGRLFGITVYRDGTVRINGHGRREALPEILRMIADALESGELVLEQAMPEE